MRGDLNKIAIREMLKQSGVLWEPEYKFCESRRFRADFAILSPFKAIVEYEGIISAKSRHTGIIGYSNDCEKYNIASMDGWIILRYTALNFGALQKDIKNILKSIAPKL